MWTSILPSQESPPSPPPSSSASMSKTWWTCIPIQWSTVMSHEERPKQNETPSLWFTLIVFKTIVTKTISKFSGVYIPWYPWIFPHSELDPFLFLFFCRNFGLKGDPLPPGPSPCWIKMGFLVQGFLSSFVGNFFSTEAHDEIGI